MQKFNMEAMPDIENLLKTLFNNKTAKIPIMELGVHPIIKEKLIGKKIQNLKDEVEFWYKTGYDYIKLQPDADFKFTTNQKQTTNSAVGDETVTRNWATENSGLITSIGDFEKFTFPSSNDFNYKRFEEIKTLLPDGMGVIGQYGDIFTMTWELLGFEAFGISLYENPELVTLINNKIGELVLSMFEYFAECESVDAIWYSDDIAYTNGLMVSPDVLDIYFFPWLKKIGDLAKQYNKPLIYHSDGILYDVMDRIKYCGVNALHPVEPKSMNITEVKDKFGDQFCLVGNIDVDLLSRGSTAEIKDNVLFNINSIGKWGGYCVGSGNSIPEYVKIENYLTMIETVKTFNQNL